MVLLTKQLRALTCFAVGAAAAPAGGDLSALVQREVLAHRSAQEAHVDRSFNGISTMLEATLGGFSRALFGEARRPKWMAKEAPNHDKHRTHHDEHHEEAHEQKEPAAAHVSASEAKAHKLSKGGLRVRRKIHSMEKGGKVDFEMGSGCSKGSENSTECVVQWDEDADVATQIHIPSGLKLNDEVQMNFTLSFYSENSSSMAKDALDFMFKNRSSFVATSSCRLCAGSCVMHSHDASEGFNLMMINPTVMDDHDMCQALWEEQAWHDLNVASFEIQMPPGPPTEWKLRGGGLVNVSLRRDGVGEILASSIEIDVLPPVANTKLAALSAASPVLAASAPLELAPEPVELPRRTLSQAISELYVGTWTRMLAEAAPSVPPTELYQKRSDEQYNDAELNAISVKFMDVQFAGSGDYTKNISMVDEQNCELEDDKDTVCYFPFGGSSNVSLRMFSDMELDPGSYMVLSMGPKLGGPLGKMFKNMLPEQTFRLPACGDHGETKKLEVNGMEFAYQPGRCGRYVTNMTMPSIAMAVPDLGAINIKKLMPPDMKMPFMPSSLRKMPPFSVLTKTEVFHSDDSRIMTMKFDVGLAHKKF